MLTLESTAFKPDQKIPRKYTGEGENVSPPLAWKGIPEKTQEFALLVEDPDASRPAPWVHWVAYGIPATTRSLPEGQAPGAREGRNTGERKGYSGPMPPPGRGVHHYHFRLMALDRPLALREGATKEDLVKAAKGHVIEEADLVGTYER